MNDDNEDLLPYEEMLEHWEGIVECVFAAEMNIPPICKENLKKARSGTDEEREKASRLYIRAVAQEILSKTYK